MAFRLPEGDGSRRLPALVIIGNGLKIVYQSLPGQTHLPDKNGRELNDPACACCDTQRLIHPPRLSTVIAPHHPRLRDGEVFNQEGMAGLQAPVARRVMRSARDASIPEKFRSESALNALRLAFARDQYVALPGLFSAPRTFAPLAAEVARLEQFASKKNFVMPEYNTPRLMATVGGRAIRRESPLLTGVYAAADLTALLSRIAGRQVHPCHDENEWAVINWLEGRGETHGWHLDDPAYALVIFVESPAPGEGGEVELIHGWRRLCRLLGKDPAGDVANGVAGCRELGLVRSKTHAAGDAYLLRADRCLHRVAPLRADRGRRIVLNFAFEVKPATYRRGLTAAYLYEN